MNNLFTEITEAIVTECTEKKKKLEAWLKENRGQFEHIGSQTIKDNPNDFDFAVCSEDIPKGLHDAIPCERGYSQSFWAVVKYEGDDFFIMEPKEYDACITAADLLVEYQEYEADLVDSKEFRAGYYAGVMAALIGYNYQ